MKYETLDVVKFQGEQEIKAKIRNELLDSCEIHKKKEEKDPWLQRSSKQECMKYETLYVAIT
jgi:hypothetical protein